MGFKAFAVSVAFMAAALPAAAQQASDLLTSAPGELIVLGQVDADVRKATALVNGDVVTDTDVEHRLNLVLAANGERIGAQERERLRVQILRNLIDEKLQIQEATTKEVTVEETNIDDTFKRVARNFKQEPDQFTGYLREQGSSAASLKQQIRAELAWSRLLRRRVEPFVNVGDDEVQQLIARLEAAKGKDEYRVGEVFLSAAPENDAAQMSVARNIVEQVRAGASFVAYARQFSESASAGVGGDLGWIRAEQLPEALRPIVSALAPGQVSEPVRVPGGIAVLALVEKRQVLAANPNDATLSMKQIGFDFGTGANEADAAEAVRKLQTATRGMGGCGRAEEVAKSIGAEASTNDQLKLRDMPEALQKIVKDMRIGEATPPFGSRSDGVRVLVLCGRDDGGAPKPPSFDEVYAQLNDQRVGMMARRYLRDLRRDAIVDYR